MSKKGIKPETNSRNKSWAVAGTYLCFGLVTCELICCDCFCSKFYLYELTSELQPFEVVTHAKLVIKNEFGISEIAAVLSTGYATPLKLKEHSKHSSVNAADILKIRVLCCLDKRMYDVCVTTNW